MADLVAGLLICLMAVQTIQHDGKFIKIPKEFTKRITAFIFNHFVKSFWYTHQLVKGSNPK